MHVSVGKLISLWQVRCKFSSIVNRWQVRYKVSYVQVLSFRWWVHSKKPRVGGGGTVESIVYCLWSYCCPEPIHKKNIIQLIIKTLFAIFFSDILLRAKVWAVLSCPGHEAKLPPHQVKLFSCRPSGIWLCGGEGIYTIIGNLLRVFARQPTFFNPFCVKKIGYMHCVVNKYDIFPWPLHVIIRFLCNCIMWILSPIGYPQPLEQVPWQIGTNCPVMCWRAIKHQSINQSTF